MRISRRHWAAFATTLMVVVVVAMLLQYSRAMALRYSGLSEPPARPLSPLVEPVLIDLEERTFRFFWDTANPKNGLVPDRYPTPSFASVAAVGFGLTSYAIGAERGYVPRQDAPVRAPERARRLHVVERADDQNLAARDARHAGPAHQPDHEQHDGHAGPDGRSDRDEQEQWREGERDIREAHDRCIDPAAVVARGETEHEAERECDQLAHETDRKRHTRAEQHAGENVAPLRVGAEPMRG